MNRARPASLLRRVAAVIAVITLSAAVASCSSSSSGSASDAAPGPLRASAGGGWTGTMWLHKTPTPGAKTTWSYSSSNDLPAFLAGKLDVVEHGDIGPVQDWANGHSDEQVVACAGDNSANLALIVPKNSKARTLKDLKGKSIILAMNSNHYLFMLYLAQKNHMNLSDFHLINSTSSAATQSAFSSGKVDAIIDQAPSLWRDLRQTGGHIISTTAGLIANHWCISFRKEIVDDHPEQVRGFLKAYVATIQWAKTHTAAQAKLLATKYPAPVSALKTTYTKFPKTVTPFNNQFYADEDKFIDDLYAAKIIKKKVDPRKIFNNSFSSILAPLYKS